MGFRCARYSDLFGNIGIGGEGGETCSDIPAISSEKMMCTAHFLYRK